MEVKNGTKKVYDNEFKIQAVKLGREIGFSKAAKELGVNIDTLYGWNKRAKDARLALGPGTQTPDTAMSLTEGILYCFKGSLSVFAEGAGETPWGLFLGAWSIDLCVYATLFVQALCRFA